MKMDGIEASFETNHFVFNISFLRHHSSDPSSLYPIAFQGKNNMQTCCWDSLLPQDVECLGLTKPKQIIQFVVSISHPGFESPTISHVPHLAPGKVSSTLLTKLRGNRNPGGPGCKKHETSTWVKNHVTSVKLIPVKLSKHSRTQKNLIYFEWHVQVEPRFDQ